MISIVLVNSRSVNCVLSQISQVGIDTCKLLFNVTLVQLCVIVISYNNYLVRTSAKQYLMSRIIN